MLAFASVAQAQQKEPTAADLETARDLYKQGRELEKKGDLKGAFEKLRAAHAVGRTPLTAIELARVEVLLGQVIEAREVCLGVARMPVESDESVRSATARKEAAKLAEDLKLKVATVVIGVTGVAAGDHVTVAIDGLTIPEAAIAEPRKVNPGKHTVTAHVDGGAEVQADVEVSASQTKEVSLAPPAAPVIVKPPELPPVHHVEYLQPPPPAFTEHHKTSTAFAVIGFTVAGIGLIGGAITGGLTISRKSELDTLCAQGHCGKSEWSALDDARALGDISTGLFVVGGVGLLTGVLALALRSPSHAAVVPQVGLGTLGVRGAF